MTSDKLVPIAIAVAVFAFGVLIGWLMDTDKMKKIITRKTKQR